MPSARIIRLGTRASLLARWQADWVASRLRELEIEVTLVPIVTHGDQQQSAVSIAALGNQGVFTKEIQHALLSDQIDLAVHSLKDLPTDPVPGLCLAAVPERAPVGDVLVSKTFSSLETLPKGAVVGTGSLRRRAQLLRARPDLATKDVRGNLDTRLQKLDRGDYDALILAEAGLRRLGLEDRITQALPLWLALPAVGQGALGLETRSGDEASRRIVERLDHPPSHSAAVAERAMLAALEGGCLAPIAAWARVDGDRLVLTGRVLRPDGTEMIEATLSADVPQAVRLGAEVAKRLISRGAAELIESARQTAV
jgi:hydroxymethylbilane synthase